MSIKGRKGFYDATSDETGFYNIQESSFPDQSYLVLEFKDIDGALNGNFINKDATVDFTDVNYTEKSGKWYSGKKQKTINIELEPKK